MAMLLGVHMLPREHLQQHEAEGRAHRCWLAQRGRTEGVRGGVGAGSLLRNVPAAGEAQAAAVRGTGLRPGLTSAEPQQPSLARSSLERFLNETRLFTRHSAAQLFEAPSLSGARLRLIAALMALERPGETRPGETRPESLALSVICCSSKRLG